MAFIRLYKDSDFDACAQICIETLPPTLASSPAAAKLSPYLWTHPYTFLSPSTCHVLDDGTGNAVGYCIGCPDIHAFVGAYPRYITTRLSPAVAKPDFSVREPWLIYSEDTATPTTTPTATINPPALAQNAYQPAWLLLEGKESLAARWRATMHIDLLPDWQGRGWGRRLIERFVASVRGSGADFGEGEHIGVAGENGKVVPFYERVGFRVVEGGEREGNIWMVRDIERV
ncbi:acetyltransferase [Hypoxylon argillaceum]|nr:acetyltransferase [Hypoxylon argillaceum]